MKNYLTKITALCFVATSLLSANAFAKTEKGFTVGAGITQNDVDYHNNLSTLQGGSAVTAEAGSTSSDTSIGYALNLKYSIPLETVLDGLYLAPSIFYEDVNSSTVDNSTSTFTNTGISSRSGLSYSINSRHGAKLDLGYDIMDQLSVYAFAGVSVVDYLVDASNVAGLANIHRTNSKASSEIIGLGLNYEVVKNWLVNLEYNVQQFNMNAEVFDENSESASMIIGTKIESMQLGLAYRF